MSLVQMKDNGQVTIPAEVREKIAASKGDMFEVLVIEGDIVLRPKVAVVRRAEEQQAKSGDIRSFIGSGRGLFKTPEEADAFIRAERGQWN